MEKVVENFNVLLGERYEEFLSTCSYGREKIDGGVLNYYVNNKYLFIDILYVDHDKRSRGLGRKLVDKVINAFPQHTIFLVSIPQSEGFWEKMGFSKFSSYGDEEYPIMVLERD